MEHRIGRRALVALVAGALLVLTSAGSCGDGGGQQPGQGGTSQQDDGGFGY